MDDKQLLDHLKERHFDTDVHPVWLDASQGVVTFPMYNLTGHMVGFQQYRPDADKKQKNSPRDGRYFTYRNKDTVSVWGLESWYFSNTLFITEGIFDACRLTNAGYSAVAVISFKPTKSVMRWLYMVRQFRPVVAVCDGGSKDGLRLRHLGATHHVCPENHDMGDVSNEYLMNFLEGYD